MIPVTNTILSYDGLVGHAVKFKIWLNLNRHVEISLSLNLLHRASLEKHVALASRYFMGNFNLI